MTKHDASSRAKPSRGWLDDARKVADDADRWFVSIARGLGQSANWTKREAAIVVDSAKSAAETTRVITGKMLERMKPRAQSSSSPTALDAALEQLGELVFEHAPGHYAELGSQARFWKLLARINKLRRAPTSPATAPGASAAQPPEAGPPEAGPPEAGPPAESASSAGPALEDATGSTGRLLPFIGPNGRSTRRVEESTSVVPWAALDAVPETPPREGPGDEP